MIAYTLYATDGRVRLEAESLVKTGYEVTILTLASGDRHRSLNYYGVNVIELNVKKYRGKSQGRYLVSYLSFLIHAFLACSILFLRRRFDVIHVHNMPDILVFSSVIPRLLGCKVILDIHDSMPETYWGKFTRPRLLFFKLLRLEQRVCCKFAHRVICVNDVQGQVIAASGVPAAKLRTLVTIPSFGHPMTAAVPRQSDHRFRVVNHGTISKRLGIDMLITAAAELVRMIPEFELDIIGEGDDLDEMQRIVASLGLSRHVRFRKGLPWHELRQELLNMDVGVVANRRNIATELMLPSKLLDYAAIGVPAVVPQLRAIEHYFTSDMVCYFEPENVQSLVQSVQMLYRDKHRRVSQARRARGFIEAHDWQKKGGVTTLYAELCGRPTGGTGVAALSCAQDSEGDITHDVKRQKLQQDLK